MHDWRVEGGEKGRNMARNFAAWWVAGGFLIAIGTGVAVATGVIPISQLAQDASAVQSLVEKRRAAVVVDVPDATSKDISLLAPSVLQKDKPSLSGERNKMPTATSVRTVRVQNSDFPPRVYESTDSASESITNAETKTFSVQKENESVEFKTGAVAKVEEQTVKADGQTQPARQTGIRLHVDGKLTESNSGEDGKQVKPRAPLEIPLGEHTLRLEVIERSTGKTLARTDVPIVQKSLAPQFGPQLPIDGVSRIMVREGETLWSIARRRYGSGEQYRRIFEANRAVMPSPDAVEPGQVLELPE